MGTRSNFSTAKSSAAAPAAERHARPTLQAIRCECQRCHAHTFLVLRTIGNAKCGVCESYDLAPVEEQPAEQDARLD